MNKKGAVVGFSVITVSVGSAWVGSTVFFETILSTSINTFGSLLTPRSKNLGRKTYGVEGAF